MSKRADSRLNVKIRVVAYGDGSGLFAVALIERGDLLIDLSGELLLSAPTRESLQVGAGVHVVGRPETVAYLNHSCRPNAILRSDGDAVTALRRIFPGQEVTVNYLATERDMASGFQCTCGSSSCYGWIRGFRHLSPHQQRSLGPLLAPYLRDEFIGVPHASFRKNDQASVGAP
jgi:hypothetical protein